MIRVVNIKENNPSCDYALFVLDEAIRDAKLEGVQVLVVIHGYGSHGRGGLIKAEVRKAMQTYKKQGKIVTYVAGEEWSDVNKDKSLIESICPEIILNSNLQNLNSGVSVILLYK